MTAAGGSLDYFSLFFQRKIKLYISCESSAWQRIHMKHEALLSSKDKSKKIKVSSAAILLASLRVRIKSLSFELHHKKRSLRKCLKQICIS